MGASNVKAVYAQWGDLPHASFRLLAYMALRSMDADNPPRYWGGREDLAAALGREVPPENTDDPEVCRQRNAAFKVQRDATGILTQRGAIKVIKNARGGQRQEWALNLWPSQVHEKRAPEEEEVPTVVHEKRAPQVHEKRADRCTNFVAEVHEKRAPKEDQEPQGDDKRISQSAQDLEGVRWLHGRGYRLTDQEALVVIKEARRRSATEVRSMVKYLTGMAEDEHGHPKADLADIVSAVMDLTRQREAAQEAAARPQPEPKPSPPPAAAPVLDIGPAKDPFTSTRGERDKAHADVCRTPRCPRCKAYRPAADVLIRHTKPESGEGGRV